MSKKRLVTHNGSFHADDLFAAATLSLYLDKKGVDYEIVRTRDAEVIVNADYVFDVGGIYDSATNRFDHHQKGGGGKRENGIPYAAFGLVWKHFGMELCENNQEVWNMIDREIVSPIDSVDNGINAENFENLKSYNVVRAFLIFEPTWKETENKTDQIFIDQVKKIIEVLSREIKVAKDNLEGIKILEEAYLKSEDKRIITLDQALPRYLYQKFLSNKKEPFYLITPSSHSTNYKVEAVSKNPTNMESRLPFPISWRGFINNESNKTHSSDLQGIYFVHNNGFLANLDTKENAIKFAEKSLNYKKPFSFSNFFKM